MIDKLTIREVALLAFGFPCLSPATNNKCHLPTNIQCDHIYIFRFSFTNSYLSADQPSILAFVNYSIKIEKFKSTILVLVLAFFKKFQLKFSLVLSLTYSAPLSFAN